MPNGYYDEQGNPTELHKKIYGQLEVLLLAEVTTYLS